MKGFSSAYLTGGGGPSSAYWARVGGSCSAYLGGVWGEREVNSKYSGVYFSLVMPPYRKLSPSDLYLDQYLSPEYIWCTRNIPL